MIKVMDITKRFEHQLVLDNVSLSVGKGTICGIVGRNGSGKSVLLKCIVGLNRPDSGTIVVQGKRIGKDTDFAEDVGFIINRPGFMQDISGLKNLKYLAALSGKIKNEQVAQAMYDVELDPYNKKHVGKYSMGMRQRLGIAQALMEDPSILILDEPMNALDDTGANGIRALLRRLRENGKTIIITSHDQHDIDILCDTVCRIDAGKLEQMK